VEPDLLGDDRRVGLDDEHRPLDPERPAGAVGGGRALGDDSVEGRHRPGAAEFIGEPEPRRGIRDEVADPGHRAAAPAGILVLSAALEEADVVEVTLERYRALGSSVLHVPTGGKPVPGIRQPAPRLSASAFVNSSSA